MAAAPHLVVIAYDIPNDRDRARLAKLLEAHLARVQDSVFEGWMRPPAARALFQRAARLGGLDGSVRLYLLPKGAVPRCLAHGFPPAPEAEDFLLV